MPLTLVSTQTSTCTFYIELLVPTISLFYREQGSSSLSKFLQSIHMMCQGLSARPRLTIPTLIFFFGTLNVFIELWGLPSQYCLGRKCFPQMSYEKIGNLWSILITIIVLIWKFKFYCLKYFGFVCRNQTMGILLTMRLLICASSKCKNGNER